MIKGMFSIGAIVLILKCLLHGHIFNSWILQLHIGIFLYNLLIGPLMSLVPLIAHFSSVFDISLLIRLYNQNNPLNTDWRVPRLVFKCCDMFFGFCVINLSFLSNKYKNKLDDNGHLCIPFSNMVFITVNCFLKYFIHNFFWTLPFLISLLLFFDSCEQIC